MWSTIVKDESANQALHQCPEISNTQDKKYSIHRILGLFNILHIHGQGRSPTSSLFYIWHESQFCRFGKIPFTGGDLAQGLYISKRELTIC